MRLRLFPWTLGLLLLLLASPASEQFSFRGLVGGGVAIPAAPEPFQNRWSNGLGVELGAEMAVTDEISMWILGEYNHMSLDDDATLLHQRPSARLGWR